jgi:lipopolysaccharide transport system permease protein
LKLSELEHRSSIGAASPVEKEPTLIRPAGRWPGIGLVELWSLRRICLVLARRNLMVRYRQTLVGASWAMLQPVLLMAVFTVFFGLFARYPSQGVPFAAFFLSGLVIWQVASKILNEGSASVVANSALVNRVYLPRAYFPASVALSSLVDLFFGLIALAVVLAITGVVPQLAALLAPVFIAIAMAASLGVALFLSALNVAYRDVTQLLPFLSQLWMFGSPIIYPSTIVPDDFRWLYDLNPMVLVVDGFRWGFTGTPAPDLLTWSEGVIMAALLLVTGFLFFRRREATFADSV